MPKPATAKECIPSKVANYNRRKRNPTKLKPTRKNSMFEKDVKWDVNVEITAEILEDMGVATLEDVSCDKIHKEEPTPESRAPSYTSAPKIPRCGPNTAVAHSFSGSPSFSGVSQNFGISRKCRIEENSGEDMVHRIVSGCSSNRKACFHKICGNSRIPGKCLKVMSGPDPFVKLSDEIILHILKWLPKSTLSRCALVCKRWKTLSYDDTLWRRVDLSKKYIEPGVLGRVVERGAVVLRLAMSNVKCPVFFDHNSTSRLENNQRFSKLQFLDLSMACISSEALSDLVSVCSHLRKISLEHCPLDDSICRHLGANPNLEVINMSMCRGLKPEGIYAIASNCLRLQSWNLAWTNLSLESMNVLSQCIPSSVKKLNISGHRDVLNDNHVAKIAERCPNISEFDLSDSTQLTAITFEILIHSLPRLEALHTSRCYNITPNCYFELVHVRSLRCLSLYGMMNDAFLESVRQKLPNVEVNRELFSTISRPTVGVRRTSIWGLRVRD